MREARTWLVVAALVFGVTTAFASESIEETTSALEDAIAELDDARENLEYYR